MPDAFLLDTSAFLTLTDREPGVDRVRELLRAAKRG
jgi:PIN domain nuclease of toxin-antitoxin system